MAIDINDPVRIEYPIETPEEVAQYVAAMSRPVSPDEMHAVRKHQAEFLEEFGAFEEAGFRRGFWIGASPDGRFIGFLFTDEDGAVRSRLFLRTQMAVALIRMLSMAFDIAIERSKTASETAGSA